MTSLETDPGHPVGNGCVAVVFITLFAILIWWFIFLFPRG